MVIVFLQKEEKEVNTILILVMSILKMHQIQKLTICLNFIYNTELLVDMVNSREVT